MTHAPSHELEPARLAEAITCTVAGLRADLAEAWRARVAPEALAASLLPAGGTARRDEVIERSRAIHGGATAKLVERALRLDSLRGLSSDEQGRIDAGAVLRGLHLDEPELCPTVAKTPFGFASLRLFAAELSQQHIKELIRIHIWEAGHRPPVQSLETLIHSHELSTRSWILSGRIANEVYRLTPNDGADKSYALYSVARDRYSKSVIRNTQNYVNVDQVLDDEYGAGDTYEVPLAAYHRNRVPAEQYTATLFYFGSLPGWRQSFSVGPGDGVEFGTNHLAGYDEVRAASILGELCTRVIK
jgi:hypothetical protein